MAETATETRQAPPRTDTVNAERRYEEGFTLLKAPVRSGSAAQILKTEFLSRGYLIDERPLSEGDQRFAIEPSVELFTREKETQQLFENISGLPNVRVLLEATSINPDINAVKRALNETNFDDEIKRQIEAAALVRKAETSRLLARRDKDSFAGLQGLGSIDQIDASPRMQFLKQAEEAETAADRILLGEDLPGATSMAELTNEEVETLVAESVKDLFPFHEREQSSTHNVIEGHAVELTTERSTLLHKLWPRRFRPGHVRRIPRPPSEGAPSPSADQREEKVNLGGLKDSTKN